MGTARKTKKKKVGDSQRAVLDELSQVIAAIKAGQLDRRADVAKVPVRSRALLQGVNEMLDALIAPINMTADYVDRISKGIIPEKITQEYKGDFNEIKNSLNGIIFALNALIQESRRMAEAAKQGQLDRRPDLSAFHGAWATVVESLNRTVDAMVIPIRDIGGVLGRMAGGDLRAKVTNECKGDCNTLKTACNELGDQLRGLQEVLEEIREAALAGELEVRGDTRCFKGEIAGVVEGVNAILDAIVAPLEDAAKVLEAAANKDLSRRVEGSYKGDFQRLKENINAAIGNLDEALSQVGSAVYQVADAGSQINTGSQSLAQAAAEQASSLEEITSSIEEVASMTKQNAANAAEAKKLAGVSQGNAEKGIDAMEKMSRAIEDIKRSSDETAKIVKTIDAIAFQTNLLALNAAVEAARAGDAGKGFAVVAEEVRNLAQRSAEAAKNTANMIEEAVKNADNGVQVSQEVAESLKQIAEGSRKVHELVSEIAAASKEQTQGIDQVNTAVNQMDKVSQQNAANSEESAAAAEELNAQAQELSAMVNDFILGEAGQTAAASLARARSRTEQPRQSIRPKKGQLSRRPRSATSVTLKKKSGNGDDRTAGQQPEDVIPLDKAEQDTLAAF